jgi:GNAT superfamily N-acetyltransferase
MSLEHNDSAQCFVAQWDDKPVAFVSTLSLFGKGIINSVRVHRMVVLPDYQGLGISRQLLSTIAAIYRNNGTKLYIKSVNPAIGFALAKDNRWSPTAFNGRRREGIEHSDPNKTDTHQSRPSFCYRYDGPPVQGFDNLILPIDQIRRIRGLEGQLSLF